MASRVSLKVAARQALEAGQVLGLPGNGLSFGFQPTNKAAALSGFLNGFTVLSFPTSNATHVRDPHHQQPRFDALSEDTRQRGNAHWCFCLGRQNLGRDRGAALSKHPLRSSCPEISARRDLGLVQGWRLSSSTHSPPLLVPSTSEGHGTSTSGSRNVSTMPSTSTGTSTGTGTIRRTSGSISARRCVSTTANAASSSGVGAGPKLKKKRPYASATAGPAPGVDGSSSQASHSVLLDGKELMTPAKKPLRVPTLALAYAVAAEWEWQEGLKLRPYTMPLMKLTTIAIDQMPKDREKVIDSLLEFFHTDQILVRHPEPDDEQRHQDLPFRSFHSGSPASSGTDWESSPGLDTLKGTEYLQHQRDLCERQRDLWDPLVALLERVLGVHSVPSTDCLPPPQPSEALHALELVLCSLDDWHLSAVDSLASATRSVSIALLLARGLIDIDTALEAARLEEDFQISSAGFVEGGHDIDLADLKVKLAAPTTFLKLLELKHPHA